MIYEKGIQKGIILGALMSGKTPEEVSKMIKQAGVAEGSKKTNELHHLDQGTGRGLGQGQTIEHFPRMQPTIARHRLLGHVGQDRIGAAKVTMAILRKKSAMLVKTCPGPSSNKSSSTGPSQIIPQVTSTLRLRASVGVKRPSLYPWPAGCVDDSALIWTACDGGIAAYPMGAAIARSLRAEAFIPR